MTHTQIRKKEQNEGNRLTETSHYMKCIKTHLNKYSKLLSKENGTL